MLSSSSSSSSSTNINPQVKYDVFLSFRGEDTRKTFTSHLYKALCQNNIESFIDNELSKGDEISPSLLDAIERSKISVVIFSEGYASSRWCLEELVKILECKDKYGQIVIPVFYHVDPSDVRNQTGKFGDGFFKIKERFQKRSDQLETWRIALREAANRAGFDAQVFRNESEFIEEIVKHISYKLIPIKFETHEELVGINLRLEKLMVLLDTGCNDVRMIGICGMGGLGKTTIARVVFDLISSKFEGSSFLANVREISEEGNMIFLQKQLLSELVKPMDSSIWNVHDGINMIGSRLRQKKVLIVIDDVVNAKQLKSLAEKTDWFGSGSRIIVTSRDEHLLLTHGVVKIYNLEGLNHDEALQLFCMKAFKTNQPWKGYELLSKQVVKYASGLPLALEVLGSFLFGKVVEEWEDALKRLKRDSKNEIFQTLKVSFDGLEEEEKKIFLDIACFFKGKDRNYVTKILEGCDFHPLIGIRVLIEKSLISINENKLWMHDLLQEMGHQIVKRHCLEKPGKYSRLWNKVDVRHVLEKNTGTEVIEGIILDYLEDKAYSSANAKAFVEMTNLRLLKVHNINLPEGLEYLSNELRLLDWHGYPLESLPTNFQLDKIVELSMCYSNIKQILNPIKPLNNLIFMRFSHSKNLIKTPDLTGVPNLEELILEGCIRLREIHPSLLVHKKVIILNLKDCTSLITLLSKMAMESLCKLVLSGCSKLKKFPEIGGRMECLSELSLDGTAIEELPRSIELLSELVFLDLRDCKSLVRLPSTISSLKSLQTLNLSGCLRLRKFPEIEEKMECLSKLSLDGTVIEELPRSVKLLSELVFLNLRDCKSLVRLPNTISSLKSLKTLNLSGCSRLRKFPEIEEKMECLSELSLAGTAIEEMPRSVKLLSELAFMDLRDCKSLVRLPSSISSLKSLKTLNLSGCSRLRKFPEIEEKMECLSKLSLDGTAIEELPLSVELLSELVFLDLRDCKSLERLPSTINGLKSLKTLKFSGCSKLENVLENLGKLESLEELDISGTAITKPVSIFLSNLKSLSLHGIKGEPASTSWFSYFPINLTPRRSSDPMGLVLPSLTGLSSLTKLDLSDCNLVEGAIPPDICNLFSLKHLNLSKNNFVSLPGIINHLSKLDYLNLKDCKRLKSLLELPSNIREVTVNGCTAMERVSDAFKSHNSKFLGIDFVNCLKLRGNNNLALSMLEGFLKAEPNPSTKFHTVVPGSEIPQWFKYQNEGSTITIVRPPGSYCKNNLVGYAICSVFHVRKHPPIVRRLDADYTLTLECYMKADEIEYKSTHYVDFEDELGQSVSDHFWLFYVPNESSMMGKWNFDANHIKLSFRPDSSSGPRLEVKRCGVHPIYVDEVEEFNKTTKEW